jgi:UDP-galactopyranose mutase
MMYDYVIVGAGFFGATFARLATDAGKKCLVIDSRNHIAGNAYSEKKDDIEVHMYGPHIFHTNDDDIWSFINRFTKFNNYIHTPKALAKGKIYSLPFNMHTFSEIWGCTSPGQALEIINSQRFKGEPANLEEQALSLVGKDIYKLLISGYTLKQWRKHPRELPAFIIKRLPLRFTFDNNYFDDKYQGIPVDGYTQIFENMLDGIEVKLNTNYFENKDYFDSIAKKVVYTGKIDEYFNYEFGELEYRSLEFKHETHTIDNYQGVSQMNYCDIDVPWTRITEHKHFTKTKTNHTIITKEIPTVWDRKQIPCYPINDVPNQLRYNKYRDKADSHTNVIFGGRLSEYRYMDMHQVIGSAMATARKELL